MPLDVFHAYLSLSPQQSLFKILPKGFAEELSTKEAHAKAREIIEEHEKRCARASEIEKQAQEQSATAAAQQSNAAQTSATPQSNPAPVSAAPQPNAQSSSASAQADNKAHADQASPAPAPAQPKSMLTRIFYTHPWLCGGACVLLGTAVICGSYRVCQKFNVGKLTRYVGIWA